MSNGYAFFWGAISLIIFVVLLGGLFGSVSVNDLSLTEGWHRWAIIVVCVILLALIIHSVFW
jgi:hypothetical protein